MKVRMFSKNPYYWGRKYSNKTNCLSKIKKAFFVKMRNAIKKKYSFRGEDDGFNWSSFCEKGTGLPMRIYISITGEVKFSIYKQHRGFENFDEAGFIDLYDSEIYGYDSKKSELTDEDIEDLKKIVQLNREVIFKHIRHWEFCTIYLCENLRKLEKE